MKRLFWLLVMILGCFAPSREAASSEKGESMNITGFLTDGDRSTFPGTVVHLECAAENDAATFTAQATVDQEGVFTFREIPVSEDCHISVCSKSQSLHDTLSEHTFGQDDHRLSRVDYHKPKKTALPGSAPEFDQRARITLRKRGGFAPHDTNYNLDIHESVGSFSVEIIGPGGHHIDHECKNMKLSSEATREFVDLLNEADFYSGGFTGGDGRNTDGEIKILEVSNGMRASAFIVGGNTTFGKSQARGTILSRLEQMRNDCSDSSGNNKNNGDE